MLTDIKDSVYHNRAISGKYLLLLTAIFLSFFLPTYYSTNDDFIFQLLLSGYYGEEYAHLLVYPHFLLGYILSSLNQMFHNIYIWPIFLKLSLLTTLTFAVLTDRIQKPHLFFLTSIIIYSQFSLQFTVVSGITALTGLLLIQKNSKPAGIALFLTGTLIRPEAAALVLIISLPSFILACPNNSRIRTLKQSITPLAIILLAAIPQTQSEYLLNNSLRGKLNDYQLAFNANLVPQDLSQTQVELFRKFFPDYSIHTTEVLIDWNELAQPQISGFLHYLWHHKSTLARYGWLLALLALLDLIKTKWKYTPSIILSISLIAYFLYSNAPKPRLLILIYSACILPRDTDNRINSLIMVAASIFILAWASLVATKKASESPLTQQIDFLHRVATKPVIVWRHAHESHLRAVEFIKSSQRQSTPQLVFAGWMTSHPANPYSSYDQVLTGEFQLLINTENEKRASQLFHFLAEELGHGPVQKHDVNTTKNYSLIQFAKHPTLGHR